MIFSTMDSKNECVGIFADGEIYMDDIPDGLSATWEFTKNSDFPGVEYVKLYCLGKTLSDVCPERLEEDWEDSCNRMKAFIKSFRISKISLNEHCFYDLVPERFLKEYFTLKNEIVGHVLETHERPKDYDLLLSLSKLITRISEQEISLNRDSLKGELADKQVLKFYKGSRDLSKYIKYVIEGTKTGRLVTERGSFPILNLDKKVRKAIIPKNDRFVELDFNANELRVFCSLAGQEQPHSDIHEWNRKNLFKNGLTRDQAKKNIFTWFYDVGRNDELLEKFYDRPKVIQKFFDGQSVTTVFGRTIESDDRCAFNNIVQSTASDNFMRQVIKVDEMLAKKKSFVAFMVHDSIVLDFSVEDTGTLKELIKTFEETELGKFKANVSVGKNYGSMKRYD